KWAPFSECWAPSRRCAQAPAVLSGSPVWAPVPQSAGVCPAPAARQPATHGAATLEQPIIKVLRRRSFRPGASDSQ
ncbi:hypothetical protein P7K49_002282, partial [Saguinus oedipus]